MEYYIDKHIYFEGKLQPPRIIPCYIKQQKGDMTWFVDDNGADYLVPTKEILKEEELVFNLKEANLEYIGLKE